MTLLDAPKFDEARDRRNRVILYGSGGLIFALIVVFWLVSGHPADWPWNWYTHLRGRSTINHFLEAVEKNDLRKAYGIWLHDPNWQQHPDKVSSSYTFDRFQSDWSSTSPDNEYGVIQSHQIVAARVYKNVLLVGILINGRKSKALFLTYYPKDHTLNFAPPDEELYLGP
jgi:hypothetical protein